MKKVIAINGSPRKNWNTATLINEALKGAASVGAQTTLVHLYDLDFKGCRSCFVCKRKGNNCNGVCAAHDGLRAVLEEVLASDVVILGSPIYFDDITGEMISFLERLLFPNISYDEFGKSVCPRTINSFLIYTMNCPEKEARASGLYALFEKHARLLSTFLRGSCEILASHETWQFEDYSVMNAAMFDLKQREKVRVERFSLDRQKAFDIGARLAS